MTDPAATLAGRFDLKRLDDAFYDDPYPTTVRCASTRR